MTTDMPASCLQLGHSGVHRLYATCCATLRSDRRELTPLRFIEVLGASGGVLGNIAVLFISTSSSQVRLHLYEPSRLVLAQLLAVVTWIPRMSIRSSWS